MSQKRKSKELEKGGRDSKEPEKEKKVSYKEQEKLCPDPPPDKARRAYYSEILTNRNKIYDSVDEYETQKPGADKNIMLKWQIQTAVYSPIIRKFDPPITQCFLAPAERWMCYEKEKRICFPVDTFRPRVQMQHQCEPMQLPRNVEVERRRRLFLSRSIVKCLENLNIPPWKLLPGRIIQEVFGNFLLGVRFDLSILPLEIFDNEEFDSRTPQGWIDHGLIDGIRHPIPGQAFLPPAEEYMQSDDYLHSLQGSPEELNDLYQWTDVAVTSFNPTTKLFSVITLDGLQRPFEISRIYLMFKAEDPEIFAQRVEYAVNYRETSEKYIRFEFYLDCMILTGTDDIDEDFMDKIYKLAMRNGKLKFQDQEFIEKTEDEIRLNHRRALAEMQFRHKIVQDPQQYSFLAVPPACVIKKTAPERGCVKIPPIDFNEKKDIRLWVSQAVHVDVYWALRFVVKENMIVEKMSMFQASYVKQLAIDEFDKVQQQSMRNLINYLKNTWTVNIEKNLRLNLRHAGKGCYDITVQNPFIYDISKLSHIMQLVMHLMESTLHTLVFNSVNILVNLVQVPCQCTLSCTPDFVWGEDLLKTQFKPRTQPIFSMALLLDATKAYYSTEPTRFGKLLLQLYDTGLLQLHGIDQVHPTLINGLKFQPDLPLCSVGLLDKDICTLRERMVHGYEQAIIPLLAYAREYDVHAPFNALVITDYVKQYQEENHSSSEVKEEVQFHYRQKRNVESTVPPNIVIGPFYINIQPLKMALVNKRQELINKLLDMFCARMKTCIEEVLDEFKLIMIKLNEKPTSIEHIYEIKDWMETIPMNMKGLEDTTRRYILEYEVLDFFWYSLPDDDFRSKWEAIGWPYKIHCQIEATTEFLHEETQRFYTIQLSDEQDLEDKIEAYTVQVQLYSAQKDASKTHEIAVEIRRLWKMMKEAQEQGALLNQRQKLFQVPIVPFDHLNKLLKEFEPYKNLWVTSSDWLRWYDIWMDNPLVNIDGESIERNVTEMYKTMVKCIRAFVDIPAVQSVAMEIRRQIEEFRPLVPLIQAIRSPGMRERHWEQFKEETGIQIQWTPILTFNHCLGLGVNIYAENITKVAENASKEYQIELLLNKMYAEWDHNLMELTPYKTTGTYIMKVTDEIMQTLDDHIVMTQQLSFSPFRGAFEKVIEEWEETLKLTTAVIEEWIELQKQWMYLEPIFTSEDISRQLPVESKKYNSMERTWRRIMRNAKENPKIISYCPDKKLLESLRDAIHLLEIVQKGLSEYLETKRIAFPRLFFLSDDELLEILSQAKNPMAVQPHLRKVFENIARLQFEDDLQITKMFSGDDECVDLNPTLYPTANVESWLVLVEESMKNTVRLVFGESFIDMGKRTRNEWVLIWPGQIVIAGCQTFWTAEVEQAILSNKLKQFFTLMLSLLDGLRKLVKGSLSNLKREVLSALIVIEVHARDVTENLVDENVVNVNDFEWIKQLRYYWISEELKVRAVNAEFQYGYEYLGNSGRLVITPLTDRCYLTLTGALHLKFGGAPAGPAGTGKTETTKDLAKAFAIQCVVFNCSDQLDFMAMGKFFKGLASSGAWACFDEFNRIDIEVLSVVAQQITTIQKAQQARADRFFFEGCELALKQSCAVFITMNPGYAGRTELPDNLKALFRPVAMMVPNYTLIAEISLFSFGFSGARQLAEKITTTFKLSSEQLSSQDHYDFGMRAVKTVIAVAGNLKREKPDMEERQIILRSLRDVNVPKFLKDDLKLFNGIVSDLFPRMEELPVDYGILELSIRAVCKTKGLEDVDDYVKKVIQLYETTVVRHGLMLVGPTGSGKTKCYEILKDAMTNLKGKPSPSGYPFQKVHTYVLNPKSITMGQLYGEFDLATHEWTDGILPSLVRVAAVGNDKDKRWYVFDGPVDAVWIENMNTVLDDNKKLCLSSGEIIKLRDTQTMMFEVADLAVASPATVSRCGMVYLEPGVLGLHPYINCWLNRLPALAQPYTKELRELCEIYLLPGLEILRGHMKEIVGAVDSALVMSFLGLMDFRTSPLSGKDNRPPPAANFLRLMPNLLVPWVTFSLVWSIGSTCDYEGRVYFSNWIRKIMTENGHKPYFPSEGIVYDYKLHDGGFTDITDDGEPAAPTWRSWMENMEAYVINPDMNYSDIEVPTIDNVRNAEMIGILLNNNSNVLCVGPTGTGKTLTVVAKLSRNMHKKFICDYITFSARTSSNQTQDLIDSKLDRRRKGVFGPPILKRQVFFIDDFNMPALEVYGAQPPIELIRQWMDFQGWYDRRTVGEFRTIIDVNFIASMGPPGGGRNPVTARCLRHFHFLAFTEMEDSSKLKIFGTILKSWLSRIPSLLSMFDAISLATLSVYKTILAELLPTPAKTHYTFNLRDLSKVFQGMLMLDPETVTNIDLLVRLWYHENCRVYQDRLVNDEDRDWFDVLLRTKLRQDFKVDVENTLGEETILFGDFLDSSSDVKLYKEITDMTLLLRVLDTYLQEYNANSTRPMKLVLFLDAMKHVSRISRIIRQPMGNALLLGMGGSGRQSLTRLATHMAEFLCFQIELSKSYGNTEWREDIKQLMLKAGLYNTETVFLFSDTQIKSESFLEDLNNILNSGDVPNIYQPDELDLIFQNMKIIAVEMGLAASKSNLFSVYTKKVRSNMHTVISMSPIGEIFRARLRQFPALVNCCTIDWFSAWPESALQSVALQFLADIESLEVSTEVLNGIVFTCQHMHASVVSISERFLQQLNRHNYVTPTSYLELLSSYTELVDKKKGELMQGIFRLKTGLDKLLSTAEEVKVLQGNLEVLKPVLEEAKAEAEVMIAQIAKDTIQAGETKAIVEKEEAIANEKKLATEEIAASAQLDLEKAMPALLAAEKSLQSLNKGDITEVRAMKRPPVGVILVIEALCIVKDIKPNKVPGPKLGEKINDYWEPGKLMMADPGQFLMSLMNFDKESITETMITALGKYVNDPNFTPMKIIQASKACFSLCMWVHAMYKYYFVNLEVAPKKAALKLAKEELEETERALAIAQAAMKQVMDRLDALNIQLQAKVDYKESKENEMKQCEERMNRAVRLVGGLSDERVRWMSTIAFIESGVENVIGDILICAGAVAYLTPFTDEFRRELLADWLSVISSAGVPHTANVEPVAALGDPVLIRKWQLDGLPRDAMSVENAVLVAHSRRWPLFIDPQGQANKWIKNAGKDVGINVAKLADKDLIRTLESAIRFGKPMLIENVYTELDPALDPVLQRQIYKQSGQWMLKLGDNVVPYSFDFRLYITTKLPNPHYTPEVSIKVLCVNFTLVPSGLQDQLLALVVMQERPDLEEARSALVVNSAMMRKELQDIEDRILYKLSSSEGSPVDDIDLIVTLEASKIKSQEIKAKVEAAEITQVDIDMTRAHYVPVANRGQILFFCIADLPNIDPMYQYSLEWYVNIFIGSMSNTEKCEKLEERVIIVNDYLTFSLFSNVCRSLFEKHKMIFAFLVCARILLDDEQIDHNEWHLFLAGGSPTKELDNPAPNWLSARSWKEILSLSCLPKFQTFVNTFSNNLPHYKKIFDSKAPHREPLPPRIEKELDDFQHLLVLKCLRPDKVTDGMQDYLVAHLAQRFVEPQTSDLSAMYQESSPCVPLIFVLSTGTDPAADLYKFADRMRMSKRMASISLGQGQGPRAEKLIEDGMEAGQWVFFQNCHLSPSWMPRLERLIENISPDTCHRDFRIWLTSTPSPHFPAAILQNGSKMTVEPPKGIKANMMRSYMAQIADMTDFFHSEGPKVPSFKWLLFSLCLFHGVLIERKKFGPLGFNIPYEFTDGDLRICISQLHMFLLEYDDIPFKVLIYTAGHINYGGRVTDDWDRRCMMNILDDYYKPDVLTDEYVFDGAKQYYQLSSEKTINEYLEYIKKLPINDDPDLFGLHLNADISRAQADTYIGLATLLSLQQRSGGGSAGNQDEITATITRSVLCQIPDVMDLDAIMQKYPVMYEESLNTVLVQEVIRFNKLLKIIKQSLQDMLKALKGLVVMSENLEAMANSLFANQVPALWANKAYPSLKPLGAWVADLNARVKFLMTWVNQGIPPAFWISGFYFPQAFLTGTLQNFARKYIISIDTISFMYKVIQKVPKQKPGDGCIIYGLFLEGARWNEKIMTLDESFPKELYTDMPPIWMIPEELHKKPDGVYDCPVYKTLTRAGTLSTTGHSTNYVIAVEVPSSESEQHWIKRGVALFCALDY